MIPIHKPEKLATILEYSLTDIYEVVNDIKTHPRRYYYSYTKTTVKNGKVKERPIDPSRDKLKDLQNRIHRRILGKITLPPYLMGSIKGRNNVDNGAAHRGRLFNFQTDLKNFFGYVTNKMVFDILRSYNLSPDVCKIITDLTTLKGHLPQGAATSPTLANLVGLNFDKPLLELCEANGLKYTRYVDDLWFSANHDFEHLHSEILNIIVAKGFRYSHKKTLGKIGKIEGTGVLVKKDGKLGLTKSQEQKLTDPERSEKSKKGLLSYKKQVEGK